MSRPTSPGFTRGRAQLVVLSAALVGGGALLWVLWPLAVTHPSSLRADLDTIARSTEQRQRLRGRLTGVSYRAWAREPGKQDVSPAASADAAIRLRQAARSHDAVQIGAAAQFSLLTGDAEAAVALLKEAI